jgi:hypothetical protein
MRCERSESVANTQVQRKRRHGMFRRTRGENVKTKEEEATDQLYPIVAEIDYRLVGPRGMLARGSGKTIGISRTTVLFQSNDTVPEGSRIEMFVPWPVRLNGTVPLNLVIDGTTVRSRNECVNLAIHQYEFRTRCQSKAEMLLPEAR